MKRSNRKRKRKGYPLLYNRKQTNTLHIDFAYLDKSSETYFDTYGREVSQKELARFYTLYNKLLKKGDPSPVYHARELMVKEKYIKGGVN